MSRYLLLFILNIPFVAAGILNIITQYKLEKATRRKLVMQLTMWIAVIVGLALAKPLYQWLFNSRLTDTEPLSLFDVIQITGIIIVFYIANRTRLKSAAIERKLQDLHQEISIKLSSK